MSVPSTIQGPPGVRADLIAELVAVRDAVVGPDGMDPALSRPLSLEDDAVELGFRTCPALMWPWPWSLFRSGMARRDELLLAAAMLLIAAERIDRSQSGEAPRHLQVVETAGPPANRL